MKKSKKIGFAYQGNEKDNDFHRIRNSRNDKSKTASKEDLSLVWWNRQVILQYEPLQHEGTITEYVICFSFFSLSFFLFIVFFVFAFFFHFLIHLPYIKGSFLLKI